ncbi:FmdB family transcriptional regulator [Nibricoccus aquaticus]|uniref:FmdB family transcriptional regulator n=1 Tax=Nibricoccus aquaticus TaxID=2576891 RepID=A0A290Q9Z0_9BACT|nr:FmdB family transcriptional regulator [Nibricoccus aquaticus]ATC65505.1 FmdB family transcriptional regulator [Nibricoccus aquaticus]
MPIYEYYCPDNHTVYQFFAKTLAQGRTIPKCPDNPKFRMQKAVSAFAVTSGGKSTEAGEAAGDAGAPGDAAEDARMEAAMGVMEKEFSSVDENDPRAMGRMMRRMAEMTGEKIDGEMEEVVRKLEEGADPESLEDQLGGGGPSDENGQGGPGGPAPEPKEKRHRYKPAQRALRRDPALYDYS